MKGISCFFAVVTASGGLAIDSFFKNDTMVLYLLSLRWSLRSISTEVLFLIIHSISIPTHTDILYHRSHLQTKRRSVRLDVKHN